MSNATMTAKEIAKLKGELEEAILLWSRRYWNSHTEYHMELCAREIAALQWKLMEIS